MYTSSTIKIHHASRHNAPEKEEIKNRSQVKGHFHHARRCLNDEKQEVRETHGRRKEPGGRSGEVVKHIDRVEIDNSQILRRPAGD